MLRKNRRIIVFLNMLSEALIFFVAQVLSYYIRFSLMEGAVSPANRGVVIQILFALYSVGIVVVFYLFHLYSPVQFLKLRSELKKIIILNSAGILALGAAFYLLRLIDFSRGRILIFAVLSTFAICLKRYIGRKVILNRYKKGIGIQKVIVVGSGTIARDYWQDINDNPQFGRQVIGYIGHDDGAGMGQYLGSLEEIEEILEETECDEIVSALDPDEMQYIQPVLNAAGKEGLRVSMIPFFRDYFPRHPTIDSFGNSVLIDMRATPLDNLVNAAMKRIFDVVGATLILIILSPLMLVTAVLVKLDSPGPVFFRQRRVGLNRKEFTMLKFRSMRVNDEENTAWSTATDNRRTPFGSFIRKFSIDELPQLFNVIKGEMSLVGPRPELPYFVYQFKDSIPRYLIRQQVRPGMTGWAQVHGLRGDTSIEARVKYDIWYIENWSIFLDIRILILTLLGGFINGEEIAVKREEKEESQEVTV